MSFINAKIVCKSANPEDYHTQGFIRGDAGLAVSSSSLREFDRCPNRWLRGYSSPDSDAKLFGSLVDCIALTPSLFGQRYVVQPNEYTNKDGDTKPWNNNAAVCREWRETRAGKEVIDADTLDECNRAFKSLVGDEIIAAWHEASDAQVWVEAQWVDKASGLTVPVKCLIDYAPRANTEFAKCLGDLKTVRSGAPQPFQRICFSLGWHVQAAFDMDMFVAATGEDRNSWCFVGVENYEPFQPFRRLLSQDFLQIGRQTYRHALKRYCACLKSGKWPGYDDHAEAVQGWSLCDAEPWMEFVAMSSAMEHEQEDRAVEEEPVGITP